MNLVSISLVVGIVATGGSITYACIRVGLVAGRWDGRVTSLAEGLERVTESLERFVAKSDDRLNNHGERLTRVETHLGLVPDRRQGR